MTRPIAVAAVVGGAGGSLVAAGLALSIAQTSGSALLVDLDSERGGLADAWGVPTSPGFDDVAALVGELADHHLAAAAFEHPSGVRLLPGPTPGPCGRGFCEVARRVASLSPVPVLIDCGSGLGGSVVALAASCRVVLVVPADLAGCRAGRRFLEHVDCPQPPLLVVNLGAREATLRADAVAGAVGLPLGAVLPRSSREADDIIGGVLPDGRRARLAVVLGQVARALVADASDIRVGVRP
jgi:Flp pilus assembly CpaE family ATPase